jgi:hypothetical protein
VNVVSGRMIGLRCDREEKTTHENLGGRVAEGVKVDELFDFPWQAQESRVHDVGQISRQCLHVVARLDGWRRRGPTNGVSQMKNGWSWYIKSKGIVPVILGRIDQVVNFGVD